MLRIASRKIVKRIEAVAFSVQTFEGSTVPKKKEYFLSGYSYNTRVDAGCLYFVTLK